MKIEVLGPGCKRCDDLYDNVVAAVSQLDDAAGIEIVKVGDIKYFAQKGVFMTPGLIIDDELIATGKVLNPDQIKAHIEKKR